MRLLKIAFLPRMVFLSTRSGKAYMRNHKLLVGFGFWHSSAG